MPLRSQAALLASEACLAEKFLRRSLSTVGGEHGPLLPLHGQIPHPGGQPHSRHPTTLSTLPKAASHPAPLWDTHHKARQGTRKGIYLTFWKLPQIGHWEYIL